MVSPIAPDQAQAARTETRTLHALFLLGTAPIILIVWLIGEYAVNVPYGDEWSMIPLFAKFHDHQLTFQDLFRQHNEHRILFPKLIYIAFAQLTHWNVRVEMFFSVVLCMSTSACIYVLLRRTISGSARTNLLLWSLANLLIFGPVQAENWLWGFQLQIFIPTLCLVAVLVLLGAARIEAMKFGGACALAIVATYSCGNGLLLWPLIGLYLVLLDAKRWAVTWTAIGIVVIALYFVGYDRPAIQRPATGNPFDYVAYLGGFLGVPLVGLPTQHPIVLAAIVGLLALTLFLLAAVLFLKSRAIARRAAAPWIALGGYATLSAALAAYARIGWGPQQAMDSRYATIATNLYLSLIALIAIASRTTDLTLATTIGKFQVPFITAILTSYILGLPAALDHMALLHRIRLYGLANLQFYQVIETTNRLRNELMIGADLPGIKQQADVLDRLQLLRPPVRHSKVLQDGEDRRKRSTAEFGRMDEVVWKDADTFEISGWSFLPEHQRPAPCVVLAYQSADKWIAFALSDMRETRPDLVQQTNNRKYLTAGWRKSVSRVTLPGEARQISAWTLDADAGEVYKLPRDSSLLH